MAGTIDRLDAEPQWFHAAVFEVSENVLVRGGHQLCQSNPELAVQQFANIRLCADGLHAFVDGCTNCRPPHRIAIFIGPRQAHERRHVGSHLPKFPLASVRDLLP